MTKKIWNRNLKSLTKGVSREKLIVEARKNLNELASRVQKSDLVSRVQTRAREAKNQVFSVLSIPSQEEVVRLQRKIANLELRVTKLKRKAA